MRTPAKPRQRLGAGAPPPRSQGALGGPRPPACRPLRGLAGISGVLAHVRPLRGAGPGRRHRRRPRPRPSGASAPPPLAGAGGRAGPRPGPLPRPTGAALARRSASGAPPARLAAPPGGGGSPGLPRAGPWARPSGPFGLPSWSPAALSVLAPAPCPAAASGGSPLPGPPPSAAASGLAPPRRGALVGAAPPGPLSQRSRPPALGALPRRCAIASALCWSSLGPGALVYKANGLPPPL